MGSLDFPPDVQVKWWSFLLDDLLPALTKTLLNINSKCLQVQLKIELILRANVLKLIMFYWANNN